MFSHWSIIKKITEGMVKMATLYSPLTIILIDVKLFQFLPPPPPPAGQCNGKISFIEDKKSQIENSNDLTRRIAGTNLLK